MFEENVPGQPEGYNSNMDKPRGIFGWIETAWQNLGKYPNLRLAVIAIAVPIAVIGLCMGIELTHILIYGHTVPETVGIAGLVAIGISSGVSAYIVLPFAGLRALLHYCSRRASQATPHADVQESDCGRLADTPS